MREHPGRRLQGSCWARIKVECLNIYLQDLYLGRALGLGIRGWGNSQVVGIWRGPWKGCHAGEYTPFTVPAPPALAGLPPALTPAEVESPSAMDLEPIPELEPLMKTGPLSEAGAPCEVAVPLHQPGAAEEDPLFSLIRVLLFFYKLPYNVSCYL